MKTLSQTLTASNKRVQFTITYSGFKTSRQRKNKRLESFNKVLQENNLFFDEVFPRKQAQVIDTILYYLSASGIAKSGREHLANKCECSVRTITTVVDKIRELPFLNVLVGKLKGTNKYIFVDLEHENAKDILREVFELSQTEIAYRFAQRFTSKTAEKINSIKCSSDIKQDANNNKLNTKQVKNMYISDTDEIEAIKQGIDVEPALTLEQQAERMEQYAVNEYQKLFFDFINSMPMHEIIKKSAYKVALAISSDATIQDFIIAKDVLHNINLNLHSRELDVQQSVRAIFEERYSKARVRRLQGHTESVEDVLEPCEMFGKDKPSYKKVKFYDWLNIRE